MSLPLARAFARIASTLIALAALVLIGFVTSPAGFAAGDLPASVLVQEGGAAPDADARAQAPDHLAADQDEPSSQEAMLPYSWQIAERRRASWTVTAARIGAATALPGPDRPPPRLRSDLRSGSLGPI